MKNKAETKHIVYETRHFSLALATSALTATDRAQLEQRSGLTMAQLAALEVEVLASFPADAVAALSSSAATLAPKAADSNIDANLVSNADTGTDTVAPVTVNSSRAVIDAEDQRRAQQFNAHRRAKASVDAAPRLYLSYFIQQNLLANTIDRAELTQALGWQAWQEQQVAFRDYLWEQSCLECFIGGASSDYVEINANPAGAYALYHFTGYRQPALMPPPPLSNHSHLNGDSRSLGDQQRASIDWQTDMLQSLTTEASAYPLAEELSRHFSLELAQLPATLLPLSQLHPCVILVIGDLPLYFAPKHAQPPDFHNRAYWTALS